MIDPRTSCSLAALGAALVGCCMGGAGQGAGGGGGETPAASETPIRIGEPTRIEVQHVYRVEGTDVVLTPSSISALDTQAGHVLLADVAASADDTRETLSLHARVPATPGPELTWHGVALELREESSPNGPVPLLVATLAPRTAPTCVPPGLEQATAIAPISLPAGCRFTDGGPPSAPREIRTPEELAQLLACDAGVAPPAIDLAAVRVIVVEETLSPASTGSEVRDDGSAITFVSRQRASCPGDPMPMPMQRTFGFTLPLASGERTFRQAHCTLPRDC